MTTGSLNARVIRSPRRVIFRGHHLWSWACLWWGWISEPSSLMLIVIILPHSWRPSFYGLSSWGGRALFVWKHGLKISSFAHHQILIFVFWRISKHIYVNICLRVLLILQFEDLLLVVLWFILHIGRFAFKILVLKRWARPNPSELIWWMISCALVH